MADSAPAWPKPVEVHSRSLWKPAYAWTCCHCASINDAAREFCPGQNHRGDQLCMHYRCSLCFTNITEELLTPSAIRDEEPVETSAGLLPLPRVKLPKLEKPKRDYSDEYIS